MDDWIDVIVLLLLQFLNVFLGFFEELKARGLAASLARASQTPNPAHMRGLRTRCAALSLLHPC
jgi:hypothetical protein